MKQLNYANVTATLALIFAMGGGALAANHYIITSTRQIAPGVLRELERTHRRVVVKETAECIPSPCGYHPVAGVAGQAGARGAEGLQGRTGATGPQGPVIFNGPTGERGFAGSRGATGTTGPTGPTGTT